MHDHAMLDHGSAGDDVRFTGEPAGVLGAARPALATSATPRI